jgi:flavin-binding protein dodecin
MSKTVEQAKSPATIQMMEMVGVSKKNWSDAARQAVERASETDRHITGLDILHSTAVVRDGKIVEYHVNVKLAYITEPTRIEG